jgi:hypothetical protein
MTKTGMMVRNHFWPKHPRSTSKKAHSLVNVALGQVAKHIKARLAKPLHNNYKLKSNSKTTQRRQNEADLDSGPALFSITDEIAAAPALVALADVPKRPRTVPSAAVPIPSESGTDKPNSGLATQSMLEVGRSETTVTALLFPRCY